VTKHVGLDDQLQAGALCAEISIARVRNNCGLCQYLIAGITLPPHAVLVRQFDGNQCGCLRNTNVAATDLGKC
jgi:hypothetical protein